MKKLLFTLLLIYGASLKTIAQPGQLDSSFAVNGSNILSAASTAYCMALLPDGRTIVAGTVNGQFALLKYQENGMFDSSFGHNGILSFNSSFLNGVTPITLIAQNDGNIVIAGHYVDSITYNAAYNWRSILLRFRANGQADNAFGNAGYVIDTLHNGANVGALVVQPDGKYLLASSSWLDTLNSGLGESILLRYNTNGSVDTTFCNCTVKINLRTNYAKSSGIAITAIVLHPGGAITLGAQGGVDSQVFSGGGYGGGSVTDFGKNYFTLIRYKNNGIIDSSFGRNGLSVLKWNGMEGKLTSMCLTADEKIIASGYTIKEADEVSAFTGPTDFIVAKYNSNGTLDSTFGTNGATVNNIGGNHNSRCYTMAVQPDGRILLAGELVKQYYLPFNQRILARYNGSGIIDNSFGKSGVVLDSVNWSKSATSSMQLRADGAILVCGLQLALHNTSGIALSQYNGGDAEGVKNTTYSSATLQVYPNPSHGLFWLSMGGYTGPGTITVYNAQGRALQTANYNFTNTRPVIDIRSLPAGTYYATVVTASFKNLIKLLKL